MAHDVFISYSSKDKITADAVCATLESHAIRCWIAPRDVKPGEEYAAALVRALHDSRVLVLVFSSGANQSPQVLREVERAVSRGLPILPFRIEDVPPSEAMEYYIASRHWLDALTPPMEDHLVRLAETAKFLLSRASGDAHTSAIGHGFAVQPVPPVRPKSPPASTAPAAPQNDTIPHQSAAPAVPQAMYAPPAAMPPQAPGPAASRPSKISVPLIVAISLVAILAVVVVVLLLRHHNEPPSYTRNVVTPNNNSRTASPAYSPPPPVVRPPANTSSTNAGTSGATNGGATRNLMEDADWQNATGERHFKDKDYKDALYWFQKSAAQGNAYAENHIGWFYMNGLGVPINYTFALSWFNKAAAQELPAAQENLGWMYQHGLGVSVDLKQAFSWFQKGAFQGNAAAQDNLGVMYFNGHGTEMDKVQGAMWYIIAADNGSPAAPGNVERLASQLTPAELSEAKRRAAQYEAQHPSKPKQ
jgi:hypothetical protein